MSEFLNSPGATPPGQLVLNSPDAYDIWVLWRATGGRFLPSQLIAEPVGLLHDMLALDAALEGLRSLQEL